MSSVLSVARQVQILPVLRTERLDSATTPIAIQQHRTQIIATWHGQFDEDNKNHQKKVFRQATRRALLDLGLLTITRRSIALPLKRKKGDNIP
jgi:hypothetical protein